MSSTLFIVLVLIAFIGLWTAMVLAPRWFARSLHRHRIWALRDQMADDVIAGHLPGDHAAVKQLLNNIDRMVRSDVNLTLSDVLIFNRQFRKLSQSALTLVRNWHQPCSREGLTSEQCQRMESYEKKFQLLLVGLLILGSWFGVIFVACLFLWLFCKRAVWALGKVKWSTAISLTKFDHVVSALARQATDAAAGSSLGDRVSETLPVLPKDYPPRPSIAHISLLHSHSNSSKVHSLHD